MNPLSTSEVARRVGVHPITLERWLAQDRKLAPKTLRTGRRVVRLWELQDVAKLKLYKATQRRGPKSKKRKKEGAR